MHVDRELGLAPQHAMLFVAATQSIGLAQLLAIDQCSRVQKLSVVMQTSKG